MTMGYYKKAAACYHWCIVPLCNNTTIKTPEKAFIQVPLEDGRRWVWIKASGRNPDEFSKDSIIFVCEDHFELQHGLENYIKGNSAKIQDMTMESSAQNKFNLPSCSRKRFRLLKFTSKHAKKQSLHVAADNVVKCRSQQENHISNNSDLCALLKGIFNPEKPRTLDNTLATQALAEIPVQLMDDLDCKESNVMCVDSENISKDSLEESKCEKENSDPIEIGHSEAFKTEKEFENEDDSCGQQREIKYFSTDNIKIDIIENTLQDPGRFNNDSTAVPEEDVQKPELDKQSRITVYDKIHVCFFCEKVLQKMGRHLQAAHSQQPFVAKLSAMPMHSRARRDGFMEILRAGDFQNNINVLTRNHGKLVVARRQQKGSAGLYGPCPQCLGFFLKKTLWKHARTCKQMAPFVKTRRERLLHSSAFVASYANAVWAPRFDVVVSPGLCDDEVGRICRSDKLIREYGIFLYRNIGRAHIGRVKKKMRVLGALVATARGYRNKPDLSLSELISPDNFDLFVRCARSLSDFSSEKAARELRSAVQICLLILRGMEFKPDFLRENAEHQYSNRLFDRDWTREISDSGGCNEDPNPDLNFVCGTEKDEANCLDEVNKEKERGGEMNSTAERRPEKNHSYSRQIRSKQNESCNHSSITRRIGQQSEVVKKTENDQCLGYEDMVSGVEEKNDLRWKTSRKPSKSQKVKKRKKWTYEEVEAVMEYFSDNVRFNIIPNKRAASHCIETAKDGVLKGRSWSDVKFCVYNRIKKNKNPD